MTQDSNNFEWLKQCRVYYHPDANDDFGSGSVQVSVCDTDFVYAYEYLGCKERLVITPLTDRYVAMAGTRAQCPAPPLFFTCPLLFGTPAPTSPSRKR